MKEFKEIIMREICEQTKEAIEDIKALKEINCSYKHIIYNGLRYVRYISINTHEMIKEALENGKIKNEDTTEIFDYTDTQIQNIYYELQII